MDTRSKKVMHYWYASPNKALNSTNVYKKFLYDHIAYGSDFQARVKWQAKTVVVWDNRVTSHSALIDWHSGQRRHLARIAPQAEAPNETPFESKA